MTKETAPVSACSPNKEFLDGDTPTVTLAGLEWPIPQLAPKQNRIIVPLVMKLAPRIMNAVNDAKNIDLARFAEAFDEKMYDDLVRINFTALSRAHKGLTMEEFIEMPIETLELVQSFFVIAKQTGLIKARTEEDEHSLGEALATTLSRPTGT